MRTTLASRDTNAAAQPSTKTKDVWLVYAPMSNSRAFADALCALYYLPEQYKLMVVDTETSHKMPAEHHDLMDRVQIETDRTGLSEQAAPFAFIYAEGKTPTHKPTGKIPMVVVTDQPEQFVKDNEWDGFTVPTGTPEALASAILNIARTSLYNGLRLIKQPLTS